MSHVRSEIRKGTSESIVTGPRTSSTRRIARRAGSATRDIPLRAAAEIDAIRAAGRIVQRALAAAAAECAAGATTLEVADAAAECIDRLGGDAIFRSRGFPAAACVSVNEEVVHGIPGSRRLLDGDIVTIDCGVRLDGWCADAAITCGVGRLSAELAGLVRSTREVLERAIAEARPGRLWSEIAGAMESMARARGFGIVRDYVGHGIGRELHEPPEVPSCCGSADDGGVGGRGSDFTLRPGMTLAIEPILLFGGALVGALGGAPTVETGDGWTVVTADGRPACHFEHTVAITRDGVEVLTRAPEVHDETQAETDAKTHAATQLHDCH